MSNQIKVKRGLKTNLPIFALGELGYTTDEEKLYVGGTSGNVLLNVLDYVSVKKFGAKGDGTADDTTAIQNAVNYCASNNKTLYFPKGRYKVTAKITSSTGNIIIVGENRNNTVIILSSTTASFEFTLLAGGVVDAQRFSMINIGFELGATLTNPAVFVKWTAWTPTANYTFFMANVDIKGDYAQNFSFTDALKIEKGFVGSINDCLFIGGASSLNGINLIDCIGIKINQPEIWGFTTGIKIRKSVSTQSEGIYITNGFIYNVDTGVDVDNAIHIQVINTHIAIYKTSPVTCIRMAIVEQAIISDCLLYSGGNTVNTTQKTITLDNCKSINTKSNNLIALNTNNTQYGVLVFESSFCKFTDNYIENAETGIFISSAVSTNNIVTLNTFRLCTANIVNSGDATNYVANNMNDSGIF